VLGAYWQVIVRKQERENRETGNVVNQYCNLTENWRRGEKERERRSLHPTSKQEAEKSGANLKHENMAFLYTRSKEDA
jgi:hypothetical protein